MEESGACIKCGSEGVLYSNLCEKCFREAESSRGFIELPSQIEAVLCPKCGSAKIGTKWLDFSDREGAFEKVVAFNVGVRKDIPFDDVALDISTEMMHEKLYKAKVSATITYRGLEFEETRTTELRVKLAACDRCSKIYGGYYEAILQVRAEDRKLSNDELADVRAFVGNKVSELQKTSRSVFIAREEATHGGLDFYVGSLDAGKQLARGLQEEYGGIYAESAKIHSRKEGREIYRMTYLVRFPKYRRRDIIALEIRGKEKVLQVKKIYPKKVWLKDLTTGKDVNLESAEVEKARIIGGPESVQEAVIVSRQRVGNRVEMQLLDPATYKTVTVREPEGFEARGQTVKVVKYEEQIFLVCE